MSRINASLKVERVIEENILSGHWKDGMKLPSEGGLCIELGVSRTAMREAMRLLRG